MGTVQRIKPVQVVYQSCSVEPMGLPERFSKGVVGLWANLMMQSRTERDNVTVAAFLADSPAPDVRSFDSGRP